MSYSFLVYSLTMILNIINRYRLFSYFFYVQIIKLVVYYDMRENDKRENEERTESYYVWLGIENRKNRKMMWVPPKIFPSRKWGEFFHSTNILSFLCVRPHVSQEFSFFFLMFSSYHTILKNHFFFIILSIYFFLSSLFLFPLLNQTNQTT